MKNLYNNKAAGRVMWLGLSAIFVVPVLGIFVSGFRQIFDPASVTSERAIWGEAGFFSCVVSLIFSISAIITGSRAYKNGERSWALWLGLILASLAASFWIFLIVGEWLFPH